MILEPNGDLSASFAFDRGGLKVESSSGKLQVAGIVSRSPAAELGIAPGDTIERIDGEVVAAADLSAVRSMMLGEAGLAIQIGLRRCDDSPYEVRLVLRDYIPAYRG